MSIHIPREMVDQLVKDRIDNAKLPNHRKFTQNDSLCVKIDYLELEISISLDQSLIASANLHRGTIRVFDGPGGKDITKIFFPEDDYVYNTGDNLRKAFSRIDTYKRHTK